MSDSAAATPDDTKKTYADVKHPEDSKFQDVPEFSGKYELSIDAVPAIVKIRHFADKKVQELTEKYSDPTAQRIIDTEELSAVFRDVFNRYTQTAIIAPSLYDVFSVIANRLAIASNQHFSDAQAAMSEFDAARTDYQKAVRHMKYAYQHLNGRELEHSLNEAIMGYDPVIEPSDIAGDCMEYWERANHG